MSPYSQMNQFGWESLYQRIGEVQRREQEIAHREGRVERERQRREFWERSFLLAMEAASVDDAAHLADAMTERWKERFWDSVEAPDAGAKDHAE
jgi:hypothetical protein